MKSDRERKIHCCVITFSINHYPSLARFEFIYNSMGNNFYMTLIWIDICLGVPYGALKCYPWFTSIKTQYNIMIPWQQYQGSLFQLANLQYIAVRCNLQVMHEKTHALTLTLHSRYIKLIWNRNSLMNFSKSMHPWWTQGSVVAASLVKANKCQNIW